jgi:RTX calcium-binding nonapeptide repeat (4 copies)
MQRNRSSRRRLCVSRIAAGTGTLVLCTFAAFPSSSGAAHVTVNDAALLYVADTGERNVVQLAPADSGIDVFDDGAALTAGEGCAAVTVHRAHCAGPVAAVSLSLGDEDDDADLAALDLPADVSAGDGDDIVEGPQVGGALSGDDGGDMLVGGAGADTFSGGLDDDLLEGAGGDDIAGGGGGIEVMLGQAGDDYLAGGPDQDLVFGGDGDDQLQGDDGADALIGGPGDDRISGGLGGDQAFVADGEGDDVVDCGIGSDAVRQDRGDRTSGCVGGTAIRRRPRFWPPAGHVARALQPLTNPKVTVKPRRRGAARWMRVRIHDTYFYEARVHVRLTNRRRTRHWSRCVDAWSEVPYAVRHPRPPRWAYRGTARFCR